jgi:hypothetical protein
VYITSICLTDAQPSRALIGVKQCLDTSNERFLTPPKNKSWDGDAQSALEHNEPVSSRGENDTSAHETMSHMRQNTYHKHLMDLAGPTRRGKYCSCHASVESAHEALCCREGAVAMAENGEHSTCIIQAFKMQVLANLAKYVDL